MKPNLMSKMTVGIIYAIKRGEGTRQQNVVKFMSRYTDTPADYYHADNLNIIVKQAFSELLDHAEHPGAIFGEFFRYKQAPWNMNDFNAMCAAIDTVQVTRENDVGSREYINGFREVEEFDSYY